MAAAQGRRLARPDRSVSITAKHHDDASPRAGGTMNMHYEIGQFVGYEPIAEPVAVPIAPERWFMLSVTPGRDARVVRRLLDRGVCAYSPVIVRYVDRRTKIESRKPHLGKRVEKPFLAGMIFVPDFDVLNPEINRVDDIGDWLTKDEGRKASLKSTEMAIVRGIVHAMNRPHGERDYAVKQLVQIVAGPLAGFVGKVTRLDSHSRLTVFVDAMRGASVQLSEAQVEPVPTGDACSTAHRQKRKRSERRSA
ncbi:transcription termination/antitermination protein NusG [Bradyrhizobium sp. BR 10261]|uniref:transcription termination/antitermination protein NusG n=1 Tax=Bradyrhizobium sp. BR 10261 TaxID=2749992 RepID=UPI001C64E7CE|nr:KOW motif-containing protein [Bradyrhizobium sp. BR 10261]MBW7967560.1 KOW motif-containing protein [Bradyrhizobium sp. BR 10261]